MTRLLGVVKSTIGHSKMRGMRAKHMRTFFFSKTMPRWSTHWLMFRVRWVCRSTGGQLATCTVSGFSYELCWIQNTPDLLRPYGDDLRSDLISADGVRIGRISAKAQVWIDLHEQRTPCSKGFAKRRQIAVKEKYCGLS